MADFPCTPLVHQNFLEKMYFMCVQAKFPEELSWYQNVAKCEASVKIL